MVSANLTTKGKALLLAVENGLIKKKLFGKGYDISSFNRFWDALMQLPELSEYLQKTSDGSEECVPVDQKG